MIPDHTRHVGVLTVALHFPAAQSLKDKRMILKSLKDKIRSRYNVSVAELDGQDKWQVATLGVAMINNNNRYLNGCLSGVLSFMEGFHGLDVCEHQIEFY